jgi:hypothetical protein
MDETGCSDYGNMREIMALVPAWLTAKSVPVPFTPASIVSRVTVEKDLSQKHIHRLSKTGMYLKRDRDNGNQLTIYPINFTFSHMHLCQD